MLASWRAMLASAGLCWHPMGYCVFVDKKF